MFLLLPGPTGTPDAMLTLFDVAGRPVMTRPRIPGDRMRLDLSTQAAGMYVVEVRDRDTVRRTVLVRP